MTVISPARAATVAWTKLHTQIMSWVSGLYECHLCTAPVKRLQPPSITYTVVSSLLLKVRSWYKPQVSCHTCFNFSRLCFRSSTLHSGCSLHQAT